MVGYKTDDCTTPLNVLETLMQFIFQIAHFAKSIKKTKSSLFSRYYSKRVANGGSTSAACLLGYTAPKKCRGGDKPLATLRPILPVWESNPRPSAPIAFCLTMELTGQFAWNINPNSVFSLTSYFQK